jgi:hypothetical protein
MSRVIAGQAKCGHIHGFVIPVPRPSRLHAAAVELSTDVAHELGHAHGHGRPADSPAAPGHEHADKLQDVGGEA